MKIAYIFPGQGTQTVGMGKDIYEKYEEVRNTYKRIDDALGESIEKLTYEGLQEELNQTKNTQITIYAMSMAILEILNKNGIVPSAAAGLSLGEYSALTCANAISLEEGAKIVRKRGTLMQELAPQGEWAMAAIIGLEDDKVEEACSNVTEGFVRAVNYNVIELKTSGPFHTEKLQEASKELRKELEKIQFSKCDIPVIKNFDGKPYGENDNMVEILANHVINPVKFRKSIETMLDMGIDTFVEIGPGKTLSGFVRKVCKEKGSEANVFNIENVETLENAINAIKQ